MNDEEADPLPAKCALLFLCPDSGSAIPYVSVDSSGNGSSEKYQREGDNISVPQDNTECIAELNSKSDGICPPVSDRAFY